MFDSVRFELTGRCDMQCLYCHAGEKNAAHYTREELSKDRWLEIIKECKSLGVKNFVFTGGEPFLCQHWPVLVDACGSDARVVLSTNGKHFTDANLSILSGLPQVKEFRTSIDGLATNNIIREGSDYLESLENIRRLKRKLPDCKVAIQTVIYQQNMPEIPLLYQALKNIGVYSWRLSQLWKTVRTEKNKSVLDFSDYEKMFDFFAEVIKTHQKDGKPFLLRIDNVYYSWIENEDYAPMDLCGHPCSYNFNYLCVNANGDLIFCPALNVPFASVKNQSVKEAFESSVWLKSFKAITVKSLGCGNCRYIRICGGGCRADALRWLGKVEKIDPNSCCMMPRIEKKILPLLGDRERKSFEALIDQSGSFPAITGRNIEQAVSCYTKEGG
ncbi:MAG: radical SAM protein [Candidatus Pacebacteria bacterium]|nr:radical SAM protein [Candidatus Paceibacterota bacterium]